MGGSLEFAKRAAKDRGDDFDDLTQQEYRTNMIRLFYQKRVIPRIAVSAVIAPSLVRPRMPSVPKYLRAMAQSRNVGAS